MQNNSVHSQALISMLVTRGLDQSSFNLQQVGGCFRSRQKDIFRKGTEDGCGKCPWNDGSGRCGGICNG